MKNVFLTISTYFIATLMCISFFTFLFQIFTFNRFIGTAIILLLIITSLVLITDKDFSQEVE